MTIEKEEMYQLCITLYRKSAEAYHKGDASHGYTLYCKAKGYEYKLAEIKEQEGKL